MSADEPPLPREMLRQLLARHRVDAELDGDWLVLPRGCRIRAIQPRPAELPDYPAELEIIFEPWRGTTMIDTCTGSELWRDVADGSLPVLLAAFLYLDDVAVERTAWEIAGVTRAVTIGNPMVDGAPPDPDAWMAALRTTLERSELPEGTHWVSWLATRRDQHIEIEVLLDNEPWESAEHAFDVPWPARDDFSIRTFLVVQGGVDVCRAVADLASHPRADDAAIARIMVDRGVDPTDADLLVALIPLAFGRVQLDHLHLPVSPFALLTSRAGGEPRQVQLDEQPIFAEATWLAGRIETNELDRQAVARRSPEVRRIDQAWNAGTAPRELSFEPVVISIP